MAENGVLNQNLREKIQFYLIDCKTPAGKLIDISIIFLNVLVCAIFVIDTYPISQGLKKGLWILEIIIMVFFIVEYVARLYGSRKRFRHLFNVYSIIDLAAILPFFVMFISPESPLEIGFIRIIRVFRIFRFFRFTADPYFFFGNITPYVLRVIQLLTTLFTIFFVSTGLFWFVEHAVNSQVNTFGDAFYFTVVALTTVGFGDITPVSAGGKWVTTIMILSGIILIPWQVGKIVKEWVRFSQKKEVVCSSCGLKYHDRDASHCKSCGQVIYQEYDGL
jgi:voltage-gated potassium channel